VCSHCGWAPGAQPESPLYLAPGTILRDQYLVGRVLGHGGFGITYLGWDLTLARKVAVKEYFPGGAAIRTTGNPNVLAYSPTMRADYDWGLERYLEEARVVARFENHPNIVWVLNFFPSHGTAYMILEYLDGITFEQFIGMSGGRVDWAVALRILSPVMDALREVHKAGLLHRDISPDNIYLLRSGLVKVIDFGAARYSMGQHSKNLSVILKPGFAPPEQYQTRGQQGPWTDVYATACTFYRAITGQVPPAAPDRMAREEVTPPSKLGVNIPAAAEQALFRALALEPAERFQDMEQFQKALRGEAVASAPPVPKPEPVPPPVLPPVTPPPPIPAPKPGLPKWLIGVVGGVALLVAAAVFVPKPAPEPAHQKEVPKSTPSVVPPEEPKRELAPQPPESNQPPEVPSRGPERPTKSTTTPPASPPARIAVFEFSPDQVQRGQPTELRWEVENATRVTIDGRAMNPSGRITIRPERNIAARLVAEGPGGSVDRTATVSVIDPPVPAVEPVEILSFTATPDRAEQGAPVTLTWSIRGARSARISPGVGALRSLSGSVTVRPAANMRYVLEAMGAKPGDIATSHADVLVTLRTPPSQGPAVAPTNGWEVYHHHGLFIAQIPIDWGNSRANTGGLCYGTLSIAGDKLIFQSRSSNDGFEAALADVEKVEVNRTRVGGHQSFQVKIRRGKNYNFVPRQSASAVVQAISSRR
jgi:serine/threonine protein kinase